MSEPELSEFIEFSEFRLLLNTIIQQLTNKRPF